ncbi:uncharacterized protein LOC125369457 [Ricinus communis]|uniref:uncharacterized protein LOC125369457 n=1 Tax=Ricinus communis TaxID=3988 RepID=UPI00201A5083|nr:uncharacterized protein LOC125369457 [Ricinus communis]
MAENSQQFGTRADGAIRRVNKVSTKNLENQISNLTALVRQMAVGQLQMAKAYGVCSVQGRPTDIWRDHPNLSCGNQGGQQNYPSQNFIRPPQASNSGMSLEDIVKNLANNALQFQQEIRSSTQNLGNQITQLATSVSKLEAQNSGKLPSQTEINPKENVSAIFLISGKEIPSGSIPLKESEPSKKKEEEASSKVSRVVKFDPPLSLSSHTPLPPFPSRLAKPKEDEQEKEILDIFRKVEINIPLLDAIKQIPKYAKFRNVMPFSIYQELKLNNLQKNGVMIQLADHSYIRPLGVVEDVLVQVNELIFPVDFYILEMDDEGTLSVEFDAEIVKSNIFDAMKYPNNLYSLCHIDVINPIVQEVFAKGNVSDEQDLYAQSNLEVEIRSLDSDKIFKLNGHRLKIFHKGEIALCLISFPSDHPTYLDDSNILSFRRA